MTATITEQHQAILLEAAQQHHANRIGYKKHRAEHERHPNPCAIDGCDKPAHGRGWCNTHYLTWRRHGDPMGRPPGPSPEVLAWLEDVEWLISNGESVGAVCQSMHMQPGAIAQQLKRLGRVDLAAPFWRFA